MTYYYITREPTDEESWNLYILYKLSKIKNKIVGIYYIPSLKYYGPVICSEHSLNDEIFIEINSEILKNSIKMICVRCGWCCEKNCGAFMFENELELVDKSLKYKLPSRVVKLYDGSKVRIYRLDVYRHGMCIFYNYRSRLCRIHDKKPIICTVTYCARFGTDSNGNLYTRIGRAVSGYIIFKKIKRINNIDNTF